MHHPALGKPYVQPNITINNQRLMVVVLNTLLCGCEAWTVYQRHARKLNLFHMTSLRKLLSIKWQEKIPDIEVLTRDGLPSIYTMRMQSQLCWAGLVVRMQDHRLPKELLFGEPNYRKGSVSVMPQSNDSKIA